ncbi:MAG: putative integral rane protein [Eubacterium sp.]|jgi:putative membrane protein|nr:putative integral rane protein [Eubacterium sp.]
MSIKKRKYSLVYSSKYAIPFKKDRILQFMLIIYLLIFFFLSLRPVSYYEWWCENIASAVLIAVIAVFYKKSRLTNLSYACIMIFLILHSIGAHYTYSLCPVGEWMKSWFGFSRNNYDRLVGLAFGLLVSMPVMELLYRRFRLRYIEACILAVFLIVALCAINSLSEMYISQFVRLQQTSGFPTGQSAMWDSQKDIGMGLLGALINMGNCIFVKIRKNHRIHMVRYRNN